MRRWVLALSLVACASGGAKAKPAAEAPKPGSPMPPSMEVTYGRLFAKDGFAKLSAYPRRDQLLRHPPSGGHEGHGRRARAQPRNVPDPRSFRERLRGIQRVARKDREEAGGQSDLREGVRRREARRLGRALH